MTRAIRDRHHELLKDKTPEERLAFYQEKAEELHRKLNTEPSKQQSTDGVRQT
jgi:hypothetical protein